MRFVFAKYVLAIAGLLLPAYGFTQDLVINITSTAVGLLAIYLTFRAWRADMHRYFPWPLKPLDTRKLKIPGPLRASGYELIRRKGVPGDALLTSAPVNQALLRQQGSGLRIDEHAFHAEHHPEQVGDILLREFKQHKKTRLFNDKKVRLAADPLLDDGGLLAPTGIQPTRYFDTLKTNDALNVSIRYGLHQNKIFDGHEFCCPGNEIPECSLSQCANQVGMSTIALSSDNYFVIVGQKEGNAFSQRLWAPSGSGSADWKDVAGFKDLQGFIKHAASRELAEECGLTADDIAWTRIIGYGRLMHRGGLPQFFCTARLSCDFKKIRRTRPERHFVDYYESRHFDQRLSLREIVESLRRELAKNSFITSSVLWYCFDLLSRMPDADLQIAFSDPGDQLPPARQLPSRAQDSQASGQP